MRSPKTTRIREKIQVLKSEFPQRLGPTFATGTPDGVREALNSILSQQHRILTLLDESLTVEEDYEVY